MDIKTVHVICKSHLDIGFTDFAGSVVAHYLAEDFPQALRTLKEANQEGEDRLFVWTVGAWLLDLALRSLPRHQARALEEAVARGDIAYHALPFTLHSELASPPLFAAGLRIAARLDRRFGKTTIAAKMTDVPGHTRGIIAPLVGQGVHYLHIGVNTVSRMPEVPPVFLWENQAGQRLMVHYERSYGGLTALPGHDEALYFLHGMDNAGPPSLKTLQDTFSRLRARFPGARVLASTLDAYARGLARVRDSLPVIREEIGDTWIHGIGTDPKKTAALRALDRLSRHWDRDGTWDLHQQPLADGRLPREAFLEALLLVCEHTWGLDAKKFLSDFRNWNRADFDRARTAPRIPDTDGDIPGYREVFAFARAEFEALKPRGIAWQDRSYRLFERSHQEQRDYLEQALSLLPQALDKLARQAVQEAPPPALPGDARAVQEGEAVHVGGWTCALQGGALLVTSPNGQSLVLKPPLYQEVGQHSYTRFREQSLVHFEENIRWALPDNMKPGLEHSDAPLTDQAHWPASLSAWIRGADVYFTGSYDETPRRLAGCPAGFLLRLSPDEEGLAIHLYLDNKPANRKPEALFLPFRGDEKASLLVRKLGEWVDPRQVVPRGNRRSHGMDAFALMQPGGRQLLVQSLDAVLLCLGEPRLLDFDGGGPPGHAYVNLYNNLWGTNFKMWYEEPIHCRFLVTEG